MSDQRYLVTARKYRPQRFEEIVAQGHVSETLKNAITLDRLAHAYLFSGPRGVGKTTAARILAKAINCTTPLESRDNGEPCRSCDSCKTFEEGRSLNIIEIDAASNNRVEDIRELRDTVLIPPQGNRKKVYIIDEVHMLSNAAFNALLKTLEEPPPYALFIFATTEPNKVLPTILSRCQRFDFRRIAIPEIVSHLSVICQSENIQADEASLMLIAQKGDGALRDSLSAFDQAVSLCGTTLVYPELAKAFGVVDVELFFEVTEDVVSGNSAGLLGMVDRIIRQGYDLQEFLIGLSSHLRNMLVACTMGDTSLIEVAEAVKQQYATQSSRHNETDLLRLLMIIADGEDKLKTSAQPRLQLELTLLKMAAMAHAVDLKKALARLDQLEAGIKDGSIRGDSGGSPGGSSAGIAAGASTPAPASKAAASTATGSTSTASTGTTTTGTATPTTGSATPASTPQAAVPQAPASAPPSPVDDAPASVAHLVVSEALAVIAEPAHPTPVVPAPDETPQSSYRGLFGKPALRKLVGPNADALEAGDSSRADADAGVSIAEVASEELGDIQQVWDEFMKHVKLERIHVSALLQHVRPVQLSDELLVFSVPDDFHKRMLANQESYLLDTLCNFAMTPVERISFVIDMSGSSEMLEQETAPEVDPYEYMQQKRNESPVIKAIFDEFGGEMVW